MSLTASLSNGVQRVAFILSLWGGGESSNLLSDYLVTYNAILKIQVNTQNLGF